MPHSVEMPAPVKGRTTLAAATISLRRAMPVSRSLAIIYSSLATRAYPGGHAPVVDAWRMFLSAKTVPTSPEHALSGIPIREGLMRYLHTMLRVRDLDAAIDFYCNKLG